MAKTKEELNTLKEEIETLNNKLGELTEEELVQIAGGIDLPALSRIPWGQLAQLAPTSLELAAGLGKSYVTETTKMEEACKAVIPDSAEAK